MVDRGYEELYTSSLWLRSDLFHIDSSASCSSNGQSNYWRNAGKFCSKDRILLKDSVGVEVLSSGLHAKLLNSTTAAISHQSLSPSSDPGPLYDPPAAAEHNLPAL